jgi:amino acid transporter
MSDLATPQPDSRPAAPRRELTLFDSTCIIVGIIVASSIYCLSPGIATAAGSVSVLIGLWLFGGLLSLLGALCYAELATAYPREGGDYVYLTRAMGRSVGFLFAWCQLWIVRPGSIGAMAYVFADYANRIWPNVPPNAPGYVRFQVGYAAAAVLVLTAINMLGIREGKWTQNILTVVKIVGLAAIVVVGFTHTASSPASHASYASRLAAASAPSLPSIAELGPMLSKLGFAMILILFAYGGWNEMAFVSAEVRNPRKNILRALLIGTLAVAAIYVLVTFAFLHALGYEGLCQAKTVAADVLSLGMGPMAGQVISVLICISALGAINGQIFTGSRIYYAMGREHRLYAWLARWDERRGAPMCSLLIQSAITLALIVWFGMSRNGFESMVKFTTPGFWIFLCLVGISVFVLRQRDPTVERPYRVPGYPVTPLLFCLSCSFMVYSSVTYAVRNRSWEALWSIAILLAGVVACGVNARLEKNAENPSN